MELANQPVLSGTLNGNALPIPKDTELYDRELRCPNDNSLEESQKPKVSNTDSGLVFKSTDMEPSSVSVLNGEYCGRASPLSIEYVDIFEILRAEVLAAEAGEFEVIENELLKNETRETEFGIDENGKATVMVVGRHEGQDFTMNSGLEIRGTLRSDLDLAQGDPQESKNLDLAQGDPREDFRQTNALSSQNHESPPSPPFIQAQPNEGNGQVHLLESSSAYSRGAEGSCPDKDVDPLHNVKGADGDGCLQNVKETCAENFIVAPPEDNKDGISQHADAMPETAGKAGTVENRDSSEQAGQDGSSNILIVEVIGDVDSRDADGINIGRESVHPTDARTGEDGDDLLQSDKYSEHSDDDKDAPSTFSGPIAFSGMLSYSGMISYSGQIPYSGNLSLHSDSSTSTRSFAFPVLASDWNSSPAKIGPPDGRYFRRRRRWRPRFCCRRPTTLFD